MTHEFKVGDDIGECIEWTKGKSSGYGTQWYNGKNMRSHRVAWIKAYGPIPEGMWILHKCDNPPCINIDHLFIGTPKDNVADCIKKDRRNTKNQNTDKTHCKRGHEFTKENTIIVKNGRNCRTCITFYHQEYYKKGKLENANV